jgi:hypothetical protein
LPHAMTWMGVGRLTLSTIEQRREVHVWWWLSSTSVTRACWLDCPSLRIDIGCPSSRGSTIFTALRFARSCLASISCWTPGRDLRYSAAALLSTLLVTIQTYSIQQPHRQSSNSQEWRLSACFNFQPSPVHHPSHVRTMSRYHEKKRLNRSFRESKKMTCRIGVRRSLCKRPAPRSSRPSVAWLVCGKLQGS